jgi:hypothetical protein
MLQPPRPRRQPTPPRPQAAGAQTAQPTARYPPALAKERVLLEAAARGAAPSQARSCSCPGTMAGPAWPERRIAKGPHHATQGSLERTLTAVPAPLAPHESGASLE